MSICVVPCALGWSKKQQKNTLNTNRICDLGVLVLIAPESQNQAPWDPDSNGVLREKVTKNSA